MNSPARRVGVIADDLSGACDTGVQLAGDGRTVVVLLELDPSPPAADVLVIDTDSRSLDPQDAFCLAELAAASFVELGVGPLYKKIDSTLRGNIGPEVLATMRGAGRRLAVVAPSFPAMGRVVFGGRLLVAGVPVHETSFARDPLNPVMSPLVADLFAIESTIGPTTSVASISLDEVRRGPAHLRRCLDTVAALGATIAVVDAEDDDDLFALADALLERPEVLPVGSAGLAAALVTRWFPDGQSSVCAIGTPPQLPRRRGVLVLCGSLHPAARAQSAAVAARHGPASVVGERPIAATAAIVDQLAGGGVVVIESDPAVRSREILIGALESLVRDLADRGASFDLVVTGGETARAACRALEARAIAVGGQIRPGVPWGRLFDGTTDGRRIVTKAGGFGDATTLLAAIDALRREV